VVAQPTNEGVRQDVQTIDEIESLENLRAPLSPCPRLASFQSADRNVSAVDRTLGGWDQAVISRNDVDLPAPKRPRTLTICPAGRGDGYLVHSYD
jgi:hypothetical protein